MAAAAKDVLYIDVDDEITAVIEKVQDSKGKIVALVLPKRATVFQSIVNMKLLKRTADGANKNLVLITSEASLLPLAGAVGMHVAKTLQSKPSVPASPSLASDSPISVNEPGIEVGEPEDAPLDKTAPIGKLAGQPDEEVIEIDNDDLDEAKVSAVAATGSKKSFNKKLKIPNFEKFRTRLFLGGILGVVLITGLILAAFVMPKAIVTIKTDITDVSSTITVTSSPTVKEADIDNKVVPGLLKELKKSDSQKTPATGQKDLGEKAGGNITLALNDCSQSQVTVPAGTTVTSGNFNFITQVDATLQSVKFGNQCRNSDFKEVSTATVKVIAQNPGDSYNLSARNYSVAGIGNVSGSGSAMSGGVSKIVKVVSQQDVDTAKQKILDTINATANQDITNLLKDEGYFPITDTFAAKNPLVVPSPAVDSEAAEVTVNVTVSFTMAGAKKDVLTQILENDIKQHIDTAKQNILNNGLDTSSIRIEDKKASGETRFTLQTTAKAGVEQNENDIKQAVAGKKKGEVKSILLSHPGVKDVTVEYSPFWVSKAPKKQSKITVIFEQQNTSNE